MMVIGEPDGGGGGGGRTVVVGVKMEKESRELLTWALVKVAQPGDSVIALHVLDSSIQGKIALLSLVKSFDSVLSAYEGFCNLKQVDLKLKICRGSPARKIIVREVDLYDEASLIVGTSKTHHRIRSSVSVAKYCARKLSYKFSVFAVNNGKIHFQRLAISLNKDLSRGRAMVICLFFVLFLGCDGWFTSIRTIRKHCPWNYISYCRKQCEKLFTFRIGNGISISFWNDPWASSSCLKLQFPRLFQLSTSKKGRVSDFWDYDRNIWDIRFDRHLTDREIEDLTNLHSIIFPLSISDQDDGLLWSKENSGIYTVRSHYAHFTNRMEVMRQDLYNCLWKKGIPKKIRFFLWNLTLGGLNTADKIQRRHPHLSISPNVCCLCHGHSETQEHIFFHCPFAQNLWSALMKTFSLNWCFPLTPKKNLESLLLGHPFKEKAKILWDNAVKGIIWEIWLERNYRIFKNTSRSSSDAWDIIQFKVSQWSSTAICFRNYDILLINANWKNFL